MITYAPAKINLTLDVLNTRSDGFHEILTVFQTISLYDVIEWAVNDTGRFDVQCQLYEINGHYNIIWKAAKEFFKFANMPDKGFTAVVNKNIPIKSGLGGGSSDAAAIVIALAQMFKIFPPPEFYTALGCDVPFFTMRGTVLGKGKGELLTPLKPMEGVYAVIVQGSSRISTKKAYELIDTLPYKPEIHTQELINAIYANDYYALCKNCGNTFEQVAAEMAVWEIDAIKATLALNGATTAIMSGSGSAVYGLFNDEEKARHCADECRKDYVFSQMAKFI
ncbi:MAG: 4-(cytidine 5'-diphospho)-2-C-methyl-D-erythritol kinase [Oscillospiraceae bacterium]|jgi:4-diphosphocytidyl-2-C-methyl-D-erythritol kinase|nr:4-(cytidine 5'-diphospho)-2-C-methyl-D-erythritol kinase [Oscillospiraceae bacterium]